MRLWIPCQPCVTLPVPLPGSAVYHDVSSGRGLLEERKRGVASVLSKCTGEGRLSLDICAPKIIKYEFPLLGGIFFPRIYEFQEKWPDSC